MNVNIDVRMPSIIFKQLFTFPSGAYQIIKLRVFTDCKTFEYAIKLFAFCPLFCLRWESKCSWNSLPQTSKLNWRQFYCAIKLLKNPTPFNIGEHSILLVIDKMQSHVTIPSLSFILWINIQINIYIYFIYLINIFKTYNNFVTLVCKIIKCILVPFSLHQMW